MKVYVLVHEIYNYDWGEYDTKIELFKSLNDLRDYAIILSETIIEEYLQYEEVETLNEIEERYEYEFEYTNELLEAKEHVSGYQMSIANELTGDDYPYFKIYLECYGYDKLYMLKKDIMSFTK